MFAIDSIFKATTPQPASVVMIDFHLLETPAIPLEATVHVFTVDGGEVTIERNITP